MNEKKIIFGTVSFGSSFYDEKRKLLVVNGWFLSNIGYDQILVNGENANVGQIRKDVYEKFPEFDNENAGFEFKKSTKGYVLPVNDGKVHINIDVLKDSLIIFKKSFYIDVKKNSELIIPLKKENENDIKQYMFSTNVPLFKIHYEVEKEDNLSPLFGVTAREGISVLFRKSGTKRWLPVDLYARHNIVTINLTHSLNVGEKFDVLIYGPICASIRTLSIEIYKSAIFENIEIENSLVWIGGQYTFGYGVTATSMQFRNMLCRRIGVMCEVYDINKNLHMERLKIVDDIQLVMIELFDESDICMLKKFILLLKKYKIDFCFFGIKVSMKNKERLLKDILLIGG